MKRSSKFVALSIAVALIAGCSGFSKKGGPNAPSAGGTRPSAGGKPVAPPSKGDPQARFNDAVQLMKQKKLPDAEAAFIALNNDFPQYSGPLTNLGIIYAKSNRRDQAIGVLTKATSLNSKNAVAWNWLGMEQRDAGDRIGAEQAYLKALQANPNYALAHLNLGILYDTYLGRPTDALMHYKQYQQLAGKDELRVAAWIAEIESKQPVSKPAPLQNAAPTPAAPKMTEERSILPVRKQ
ncbi:MAG TPA: tetratricopeptide repeat protein [Nevskiaceae bacterium]|nr:tetratricopeptide repeat protein [Nevskiaceae bacterium]